MDLAAAPASETGSTVQHSATHHKRELIYSIQQIRAAAAFMVVLTYVWSALHSVPGTVTIDFREINIGFTSPPSISSTRSRSTGPIAPSSRVASATW